MEISKKTYSKKKEMGTRGTQVHGGWNQTEGEKSQSTGPAKLAELVKNSFCYWFLSWYLSSVDSQNDLPSLRNNQTQSPEKSIRIQN